MFVNLSGFSVLPQQPTQNSLSSHPNDTRGHSSLSGTLSLSWTGVTSLSLCSVSFTDTESRVHNSGFLDDESVSVEFADVLTRVGVSDFGAFIGIEPDLAFAAAKNLGSKLLLRTKIRHCWSVDERLVDVWRLPFDGCVVCGVQFNGRVWLDVETVTDIEP
jgi:hypothetical protein